MGVAPAPLHLKASRECPSSATHPAGQMEGQSAKKRRTNSAIISGSSQFHRRETQGPERAWAHREVLVPVSLHPLLCAPSSTPSTFFLLILPTSLAEVGQRSALQVGPPLSGHSFLGIAMVPRAGGLWGPRRLRLRPHEEVPPTGRSGFP